MKKNNFLEGFKNMPVAILPTMVGASTLSNVFQSMGYEWIKHITIFMAAIILLGYLVKVVLCFDTVKAEYSNTVPASLYAGFTMIMMILGSYIFDFNATVGKGIWFIGLILHAIHILIFTYRNVLKGVNRDTFIPSWFVTFNGIMVSTVVGTVMDEPTIGKIIVYYGITVLVIIMPCMIYRLIKYPIKDAFFHTQAILLAPSSLCLVSYLNFIKEPNKIVVYSLYILILLTIVFIIYKIPAFFSFKFNPGFAGLTFPMAIGIVASTKMSGFLIAQGNETLGNIVKQISGIQIYITTIIIGFVLYNLIKLIIGNFTQKEQ